MLFDGTAMTDLVRDKTKLSSLQGLTFATVFVAWSVKEAWTNWLTLSVAFNMCAYCLLYRSELNSLLANSLELSYFSKRGRFIRTLNLKVFKKKIGLASFFSIQEGVHSVFASVRMRSEVCACNTIYLLPLGF